MSKKESVATRRRHRKRLRRSVRLAARRMNIKGDTWQVPERPVYYPTAKELSQVGQELMPSLCADDPVFDFAFRG